MKAIISVLFIFVSQTSFAVNKTDCFEGNFSACKEIINDYGRITDKSGATEFFTSACASQKLKITCQIISTDKAETMKKTLEAARTNDALFVMSGSKADKIYIINQTK